MNKVFFLFVVVSSLIGALEASKATYVGGCSNGCSWNDASIWNNVLGPLSDVSINNLLSAVTIDVTSDSSINSLTCSGSRPVAINVVSGAHLSIAGAVTLNSGIITVYGSLTVGASVAASGNIVVASGGRLVVTSDLSLFQLGSLDVQAGAYVTVSGCLFVSALARASLSSCTASFAVVSVAGSLSLSGTAVATVSGALSSTGVLLLASGSELTCYADSLITGTITVALGATWNIASGTITCTNAILNVAGNLVLVGTLDLGRGVYNQVSGLLRFESGQLISRLINVQRLATCSGFGNLVMDILTVAGTIEADVGGALVVAGDFVLSAGGCIIQNIVNDLVYGTIAIQRDAMFAGSLLPVLNNGCGCLEDDFEEPLISVAGFITNTGLQLLGQLTDNVLLFNDHSILLSAIPS